MYSGGDGIQLSINKPKPSVATKRNPGFLIGPLFSPATFSLLPIPSWPLCLLLKIQLVGFSVLTPSLIFPMEAQLHCFASSFPCQATCIREAGWTPSLCRWLQLI